MTWDETFNRIAEHYARLAMTRGCWAYAQQQVISMEQDPEHHGCWLGLRAAVGRRIKTAGFRPHPSEQGNWWDVQPASSVSQPRHGRFNCR